MKTAQKLTITLSPEEVKEAIQRYVREERSECATQMIRISFTAHTDHCDANGYFDGATVEVTQP